MEKLGVKSGVEKRNGEKQTHDGDFESTEFEDMARSGDVKLWYRQVGGAKNKKSQRLTEVE